MWSTGVTPERTTDPREAWALLELDGAAILTCPAATPEAAVAGAKAVTGDRLRAYREPVRIATNPTRGAPVFFDHATRTVNGRPDVTAPPHVDGYMSYGDAYPDFVFLLCEAQARRGGESLIVDGQRLLAFLASDPDQRDLVHFLWLVPIEQSTPTGVSARGPIARRTPGGRITVRCHEHQRLRDDAEPDPEHAELLQRWRTVTTAAAAEAPRFLLHPGDLLCLDNYRVFHGRDAYTGDRRQLHRIWAWTDMALGVPTVGVAGERRLADLTIVAP